MKLLKKLLLIHWHYIDEELMEFENVNFLTGKNASGKSTIIDALQLLMLGDTSGHFFNKAASERSRRTLKGYLRCEVGDDGETGSQYLRSGDFTSYIVAEFSDTEKRQPFTLGAVFDSYSDDKHEHRFFILPRSPIPDHRFIQQGTPMSIRQLQAWLKGNSSIRHEFFDTNRRFREAMLGQMGGLKEKYFKLFQKAVPFSPAIDIEDFISEFVCDVVNEVNIEAMQQNIRVYRDLEYKAEEVSKNLKRLQAIQDKFHEWQREQNRLLEQRYLLDRAGLEAVRNQIQALETENSQLAEKQQKLQQEEDELRRQVKEKREQYQAVKTDIDRSDIKQIQERLKEQVERLQESLSSLEQIEEKMSREIAAHLIAARELSQAAIKLQCLEDLAPAVESQSVALDKLLHAKDYASLVGELERFSKQVAQLEEALANKRRQIQDELDSKQFAKAELSRQVEQLNQGIKPFDPQLLKLKQAIGQQVEGSNPRIFCDLLEVTDPHWQDAVEGYLHWQKFHLLISPGTFVDALGIYTQLKHRHNFHSFGLVNGEKLLRQKSQPHPDSLALKVTTDDSLARALADYLLGQVVCCTQPEELRTHDVSITADCMLYQDYVARQLDPACYRDPYIGKESIRRQIINKNQQIVQLDQEIDKLNQELAQFTAWPAQATIPSQLLEHYQQQADDIAQVPRVRDELAQKGKELAGLDLTWLDQQQDKLNSLDKEIDALEKKREEKSEARIRAAERVEVNKARVPQLRSQQEINQTKLEENHDQQWRESTGEPRFAQELQRLKTPEEITNRFSSQVARTESQANKHLGELSELRSEYNRINHLSLATEARDNRAFDREYKLLNDTYMEKYVPQIREARDMAERQFKEDFVSKLRSNIETAQQQLDEINKTLKNIPFGQERYRFRVQPRKGRRKFYDMIMDDLLLEGNDLFSGPFQEKHKEAIDDLFRAIVQTEDALFNADSRTELEKNLEEFTDYRKYLEFDLISMDEENRETRLSKMLNKRSGGETQNPFYISVLASFAQVYRVRQQGYSNTLRLIVFDEAFNKMDHQRIQESIRLAKRLGLQMIISAPTEKVADIAPLVDRNLCVTRVRRQCVVRAFDPQDVVEEQA